MVCTPAKAVVVCCIQVVKHFSSGFKQCAAGSLLPFRQEIVPATGAIIIVSIFAASIVGGLANISDAVLGGYVIGLSESLVTYRLSLILGSGVLIYGKVISLSILLLMLLLAPKGLTSIEWKKRWKRLYPERER
ncbi:hypothetical protein DRN85_05905 [Methanosarcinales archaeon]|nr:MAG: hypothetical protein DRN85_05905 [Methanosarcinales archaeon]